MCHITVRPSLSGAMGMQLAEFTSSGHSESYSTRGPGPYARVLAVGTAVPPDSYTQQELLDEFRITDSSARSMFLNGAIDRRNLVLPPRGTDGARRVETQGELLRKNLTAGLAMGTAAVKSCLARIGAS